MSFYINNIITFLTLIYLIKLDKLALRLNKFIITNKNL